MWETAEGHRLALEVLQLRLRRNILRFISHKTRLLDEIDEEFGLDSFLAKYHLSMLVNALVIEENECGYTVTPTGAPYLENVEGRFA